MIPSTVDLAPEVKAKELAVTDDSAGAKAVSCPACGQLCSEPPLFRYSVKQAAAHFCPPIRDKDRNRRLRECIGRLWQGDECVVIRCAACGFSFGVPFVGGDEEFYGILHEQSGYPGWRWDYDVAVAEAVEKFEGGRILDIGAGVGNFLLRLGPSWERYAVEGSEATRGDLEANGITVFRDLADAARSSAHAFKVVTLFQVLEHVADFDSLLGHCRRLLAVGGRLVVTVPDGEATIQQERLTGFHDMPPNHINKWTPESLSRVLRRAGFEISQPQHEPPSWRNLMATLHMKVMADATNDASVAAQVYRLKNKKLRTIGLGCVAVPALLRMLPYHARLRLGLAFALVGTASDGSVQG